MRHGLAPLLGKRLRWQATVIEFGLQHTEPVASRPARMVCLGPVVRVATGSVVTDHVWLKVSLSVARLHLQPGDTVSFDATVTAYWKGYFYPSRGIDERRLDYKLLMPAAFVVRRA